MKNLQVIPRFSDRWSHLYLEHGILEKEADGLYFIDAKGAARIPIDQLALILLGPGTSISQAAVKLLADHATLLAWTGEAGIRFYAHGHGGTHSARRLLHQATLYANPDTRLAVIRRLYQHRFPEPIPPETTLEQIRGREGSRVRTTYRRLAKKHGVKWTGRNYDQESWDRADPLNRALSAANSCLYGIAHAAIVATGYSPAIGFIHTGKMLSFVYDLADLYKSELTIPLAFAAVAEDVPELERTVRHRCRDLFHQAKLLARIIPDLTSILGTTDSLDADLSELTDYAVSLAGKTDTWILPDNTPLGPFEPQTSTAAQPPALPNVDF